MPDVEHTPSRLRALLIIGVAVAFGVVALAALTARADARDRKRGIDVSRFQGQINWRMVGRTQIRFAYVQASRGSGRDCSVVPDACGRDERYRRNYERGRDVGLRVGAYHRAFASGPGPRAARRDAAREAKRFTNVVGELHRRDLAPALDLEAPFERLGERSLRIWARTWTRITERKLGTKPILYTNNSSWQATGDTTSFSRDGHRLWVANYDVPEPLVPARNWRGRGWKIWQFTSSGTVKGIKGAVDKNRLQGGFRSISVR